VPKHDFTIIKTLVTIEITRDYDKTKQLMIRSYIISRELFERLRGNFYLPEEVENIFR